MCSQLRRGLFVLLIGFIVWGGKSLAQAGAEGPPFVAGEVAVYATPDEVSDFELVRFLPHSGISVVRVELGREAEVADLMRVRGYRAGVNRRLNAFQTVNDPLYSYQWHFPRVQDRLAWREFTGVPVIVAVLDTGLAVGGVDGIACVEAGWDVVNNDSDPDDGDGHGTHVSGTIAQATNNRTGVAGLGYEAACIMPVKVLDDSGSGTFADVAEGVSLAIGAGARVINMSLGSRAQYRLTSDPILDPALDAAEQAGVTVVCSAGNESYFRNVAYPAIYPTTIGVGATDYANVVAQYSNGGIGLDMVAPGGDLRRDLNGDGYGDGVLQETRIRGEWGYWFFDGTSMAAPHVAAAAAMLIGQAVVEMSPAQVRTILTSSALDLGPVGYDSAYGHGLLQVYDALTLAVPECTDADGDGWCVEEGDCDDTNP
ncbi:MAG: S8 family serine peptidase, partial [Acidobacteriota bacterium]